MYTEELNQKEIGLADLSFWLEQRIMEVRQDIVQLRKESGSSRRDIEHDKQYLDTYQKMIERWQAVQDALDLAVGLARREHQLLGYDDLDNYIPLARPKAVDA